MQLLVNSKKHCLCCPFSLDVQSFIGLCLRVLHTVVVVAARAVCIVLDVNSAHVAVDKPFGIKSQRSPSSSSVIS